MGNSTDRQGAHIVVFNLGLETDTALAFEQYKGAEDTLSVGLNEDGTFILRAHDNTTPGGLSQLAEVLGDDTVDEAETPSTTPASEASGSSFMYERITIASAGDTVFETAAATVGRVVVIEFENSTGNTSFTWTATGDGVTGESIASDGTQASHNDDSAHSLPIVGFTGYVPANVRMNLTIAPQGDAGNNRMLIKGWPA